LILASVAVLLGLNELFKRFAQKDPVSP